MAQNGEKTESLVIDRSLDPARKGKRFGGTSHELYVMPCPSMESTSDVLRMLEKDLPEALWLLQELIPPSDSARVKIAKDLAWDVSQCCTMIHRALTTGRKSDVQAAAFTNGAAAVLIDAAHTLTHEIEAQHGLGIETEALGTLAHLAYYATKKGVTT